MYNVLMKSKKREKIIDGVIHLVSGYFNLDVDVEIEVGKLKKETYAEAVSYTHLTLPTIYSV